MITIMIMSKETCSMFFGNLVAAHPVTSMILLISCCI